MTAQTVLLLPSESLGWSELRVLLQSQPTVTVVTEAATAEQALAWQARQPIDLILTADQVVGMPLERFIAALHTHEPRQTIAVFAATLDLVTIQHLFRWHDLQVRGYLLWSDLTVSTLSTCLDALLSEGLFVLSRTPLLAALEAQHHPANAPEAGQLTAREVAVLRCLALGLTRAEIARAEQFSLRTVNRLVASAERKLQAPSPFLLGVAACQCHLIP